MADDDLDLSQFKEFSDTAAKASGTGGRGGSPGKGSGGRGGRKRRWWAWLLVGVVLGVAGTLFLPSLVAPYLPALLRRKSVVVTGPVLAKRLENQDLLLTVDTNRGALLATFHRRADEIGLLVEAGDTVTLGLPEYAPLVNDPVLEAVKKGSRGGGASRRPATGERPGAVRPPPARLREALPPGPDTTGGASPSGPSDTANGGAGSGAPGL